MDSSVIMTILKVLLVPLLMLLDYHLTIRSVILLKQTHGQHYVIEHHELNPLWQGDVADRRWLNPLHLLFVMVSLLAFGLLGFFAVLLPIYMYVFDFIFGMAVVAYSVMVGRHISNILIARYSNRNPSALSGEVKMSQVYVYCASRAQSIGLLPLLMLYAILAPSAFSIGGVFGGLRLALAHGSWLRHYNKKKSGAGEPRSAVP